MTADPDDQIQDAIALGTITTPVTRNDSINLAIDVDLYRVNVAAGSANARFRSGVVILVGLAPKRNDHTIVFLSRAHTPFFTNFNCPIEDVVVAQIGDCHNRNLR